MVKRVIGIDIGSSSVKAAELVRSKKGIEVVSFFKKDLKDEQGMKEIAGILREKASRGVKVISSIRAGQIIFRSIVVPFRNIKKIKQIVKFETERYLTFPAEEAAVDFYLLGYEKQGGSRIMTVTVRRELLEAHLSSLKKMGVEPAVVDVDSTALINFIGEGEKNAAVVDIGAENTSISIVSGGVIVSMHSIRFGGDNFTKCWAEKEKVDTDEAEERKKAGKIEASALEKSMSLLISELKYAMGAFSLRGTETAVNKIFLSGGGAKLENLPGFLENNLGMDVVRINPLSGLVHALDETSAFQVQGCGDAAVGLALREFKKKEGRTFINLKEGLPKDESCGRSFIISVVLVSLAAAVSVLTVFAHFHRKSSYLSNIESQIENSFRQVFPEKGKKGKSTLEMISLLQQKVKRLPGGENGAEAGSVLEILREFAISVPDSIAADITDLRLDGSLIHVEGETASFKNVVNLSRSLSSSDYFKTVLIKKADSVHGRVKFRLEITK